MDIDEPNEMMEGLDAPLLFGGSHISDSPPTSSGFQDDDSGRASCCDPDLSDHDHQDSHHPSTSTQDGFHTLGALQPVVPPAQEPAWQNSIYSQVAEVMPCGETLLYPEQNVTDNCGIQDKGTGYKEKKARLMVTLNERGYSVSEPSSFTANPVVSSFPILTMPTSPEYTMVDGVGWKDSLLLKTSSVAASTLAATKSGPTPEGYLAPDLLHSITQNK